MDLLLQDDAAPKKLRKPKRSALRQCTLLSSLGLDYLAKYASMFSLDIDLTPSMLEVTSITELVRGIRQKEKNLGVLACIYFHLLHIRSQSEKLNGQLGPLFIEVSQGLGISEVIEWVYLFFNLKFYSSFFQGG
jgi:hypothetical protein